MSALTVGPSDDVLQESVLRGHQSPATPRHPAASLRRLHVRVSPVRSASSWLVRVRAASWFWFFFFSRCCRCCCCGSLSGVCPLRSAPLISGVPPSLCLPQPLLRCSALRCSALLWRLFSEARRAPHYPGEDNVAWTRRTQEGPPPLHRSTPAPGSLIGPGAPSAGHTYCA